MKRIIKFRGKRLDNGEWVYGSLCKVTDNCSVAMISTFETQDSGFISDVDSNTVGQFTGLLDHKGKEIYEGDILVCLEDMDFLPETVIFKEGCFMVKDDYTTITINTIDTEFRTIAGNVYDNPELLKQV